MTRDITVHNNTEALERHGLTLPALIDRAGDRARTTFVEFFVSRIANRNTRQAYARAVWQFYDWCDDQGLTLSEIHPVIAGGYIRQHDGSDATVKQHLAALRSLYDWMVTQQAVPFNPFAAVRGPKLVRRVGTTPALTAGEVRDLFGAIDTEEIIGLRDRALIGAMLYTFGRVSAVVGMQVKDYAPAGGRRMVLHLREKGGTRHQVPAHHKLQTYLDAYIAAAGIAEVAASPLFRTVDRRRRLTGRQLSRTNAWAMVRRRTQRAGITKAISPHSFRATGITNFLEHDGELESAQRIAAHADPRTTKLYDRRAQQIDQSEIERLRFD